MTQHSRKEYLEQVIAAKDNHRNILAYSKQIALEARRKSNKVLESVLNRGRLSLEGAGGVLVAARACAPDEAEARRLGAESGRRDSDG